jgi:hypothetical protein
MKLPLNNFLGPASPSVKLLLWLKLRAMIGTTQSHLQFQHPSATLAFTELIGRQQQM